LFEFIDKPCPKQLSQSYYQDPQWQHTEQPALIPDSAIGVVDQIATTDKKTNMTGIAKLEV
jgi:hypothetical protein